MPKMLIDVDQSASPKFAGRDFGMRPQLAPLVAETITIWSLVENGLGACLALMSGGINDAQMQEFIDEWGATKRLKIVQRIARIELRSPYRELFLQAVDGLMKLAKRRHAFAHGIWGSLPSLPDALLLVEPEHVIRHWGKIGDWSAEVRDGGPVGPPPGEGVHIRHIEVWTMVDLKEEVRKMREAYDVCHALRDVAGDDPWDPTNRRRHYVSLLLAQHPVVLMGEAPPASPPPRAARDHDAGPEGNSLGSGGQG